MPRKPAALKKAIETFDNNYDKTLEGRDIHVDSADTIEPMEGWLDDKQIQMLNEFVDYTKEMQNLGKPDKVALNLLVEMIATYKRYDNIIKEQGEVIETRWGVKVHPLLPYRQSMTTKIAQMLREFGMTPRSRSSMLAAGSVTIEPTSPIDIFLSKQ